MKTPQQKAADWEEDFAENLGGSVQPRSGGGPFKKLDVTARINGKPALFSCKDTENRTVSLTPDLLDEVYAYTQGLEGIGADSIGGLAIRFGGRKVVVMDQNDFAAMFENPETEYLPSDKAKERHKAAKLPPLMRGD